MTVDERLKSLEEKLKANGVVDIRFTLGPKAQDATLEALKEAACCVLESILSGKRTLKKEFGD